MRESYLSVQFASDADSDAIDQLASLMAGQVRPAQDGHEEGAQKRRTFQSAVLVRGIKRSAAKAAAPT